jgi:hypothetical protein
MEFAITRMLASYKLVEMLRGFEVSEVTYCRWRQMLTMAPSI